MITVPRMASVLRTVFEKEAPILARQMGVIQRNRKVNGTSLLLLFVLGWLHQQARDRRALDVQDRRLALRGATASCAVPDHRQSRDHPALAAVSWGVH